MRRLAGLTLSTAIHAVVLAATFFITVRYAGPVRPAAPSGPIEVTIRPDAPAVIPPQRETTERPRPEVGDVPIEPLNDPPQTKFDLFEAQPPARRPTEGSVYSSRPARAPWNRAGQKIGGGDAGPGSGSTAIGVGADAPGGGDGTGGDGPAVEAYNPAPEYPTSARRRGIEGEVLVEIVIGADGATASATVVEGSGCEDLDAAAVAAVKTWRFQPAIRGGKSVESRERIRFVFKLKA